MRNTVCKKSIKAWIVSIIILLSIFPVLINSVSATTQNPTTQNPVSITKPLPGCWYKNDELWKENKSDCMIWGAITVKVDVDSQYSCDKVDFYIDDDKVATDWNESWEQTFGNGFDGHVKLPWGTHLITVKAYEDDDDFIGEANITVNKVIKNGNEEVIKSGITAMQQMLADGTLDEAVIEGAEFQSQSGETITMEEMLADGTLDSTERETIIYSLSSYSSTNT